MEADRHDEETRRAPAEVFGPSPGLYAGSEGGVAGGGGSDEAGPYPSELIPLGVVGAVP